MAAGIITGEVELGGSCGSISGGSSSLLVAKYDENGTCLWAQHLGGSIASTGDSYFSSTSLSYARPMAITVDSGGDVVVTASYDSAPQLANCDALPAGAGMAFVAKLESSNGACLWAQGLSGSGDQVVRDVAVDSSQNVLLVGGFVGDISFADQATYSGVVGGMNLFVAKFDAQGNLLWARPSKPQDSLGGHGELLGVASDSSGDVLVAGVVGLPVDFGDGREVPCSTDDCAVLAKYATDGSLLWSESLVSADAAFALRIVAREDASVVVAGENWGGLSLCGTPLQCDGTCDAGQSDAFVAVLDQAN